ncbi:MAG: ATP-binding protein [Bacteroidales bacterium]|nr:ATP-binding protein [Bacteroidales bacterium]
MKLTEDERVLRKIGLLCKEAIDKYHLIEEGDRLLIGLSGGKDSLALVELLGQRARIFSPRFTVCAVHVRMTNIPYSSDEEYLRSHCEAAGIPFEVLETGFDLSTDKRKSPCFLCSWNRRKMMFEYAQKHGYNKLVLGHHQDDVLETLLMNMTFQGAFGTMPPLLRMNKFGLTIIRPMCLIPEKLLLQMAGIREYRNQKKNCPYEKESHRSEMKEVLHKLEELNPQARHHLWASMSRVQLEYLPESV